MRFVVAILILSFSLSAAAQEFRLSGVNISGAQGYGAFFSVRPTDSDLIVTKEIAGNPNGSNPQEGLIIGLDGDLYGINTYGGQKRNGTIYKIKTDGTGFKVIYSFTGASGINPMSAVCQSPEGDLYGTTIKGGANDRGTLFTIKPDGTGFKKLLDFNGQNGSQPQNGVIIGSDGIIYGLTLQGGVGDNGVMYKIKKDGTGYQNLLNFDGVNKGSNPRGNLMEAADGKLYGITADGGVNNGGVIFRINKDGTGYSKLLDFSDALGQYPGKGLIQGADSKLYGMTSGGGSSHDGVLFKIDTDGNNYTKLLNFGSTVGRQPFGGIIINAAGKIVGMTSTGGLNDKGVVFSINTNNTGFTKLLEFNGDNGANAFDNNVIQSANGDYFGVTRNGGKSNNGVIFKLTQAGVYTKLMEYPQDPYLFESGLMRGSDGNLYCVSANGGAFGFGTICRMKPDGSDFNVMYEFDQNSGGPPVGRLLEAPDGYLYGLSSGVAYTNITNGSIFKIKKDGTGYLKLYSFDFIHGVYPAASLVLMNSGELLGTTTGGGANNGGTVFKISTDGSGFTVLYDFNPSTSGSMADEITKASDGSFFGACQSGGTSGQGTIYKLNSSGAGFIKLHDMGSGSDGKNPVGLTEAGNGTLLGLTRFGGAFDGGSIYKINIDGTGYQKVIDFGNTSGISPNGGKMVFAPDGYLYGLTYSGGVNSMGTVYRIKADATDFSTVYNFDEASGSYPYSTDLVVVPTMPQTISSFTPLTDKTVGDAPFTLGGIATSSLPVQFSSSKPIVTISGNTATIVNAGKVTISALQSGNVLYAAAPPVTQTICINPAKPIVTSDAHRLTSNSIAGNQWYRNGTLIAGATNATYDQIGEGAFTVKVTKDGCVSEPSSPISTQTISFTALTDKTVGDAPFALTAASTSSLPIQFSASKPLLTISGSTASIIGAGHVTVTAIQAGNLSYIATSIQQTICIKPVRPSIAVDINRVTSSSTTGNQWYRNGTLIPGAVTTFYILQEDGMYTVKVTVDGCVSESSLPADVKFVVTGDLNNALIDKMTLFPNPTNDRLMIRANNFNESDMSLISVFDLAGRLVDRIDVRGAEAQISVTSYSGGMYIVKASQGDRVYRASFVKK